VPASGLAACAVSLVQCALGLLFAWTLIPIAGWAGRSTCSRRSTAWTA
jgi:hypothetical protein